MDLVPTLEEYDHFLSLPTPMIWVYRPPTQSHFRKQLAELLGLKTHIMDVLTRHGSGLGGSIPFDFCFVSLVNLSVLLLIEDTLWIWRSIGPSVGARPSRCPLA